jgi:hypothetical protein
VATLYHVPDEPRPGKLSHVIVNPFWPLLCVMFVGAGVSWAWFVLNGFAMGSPTRKRELGIAIVGLAGNVALLLGVLGSHDRLGVDSELALPYLLLVVVVWKIGASYWLYMLQAGSFGIYEYYGGNVQNGWFALILAVVGWRMLIAPVLSGVPLIAAALS